MYVESARGSRRRHGTNTNILALTDHDVDELAAGRELASGETMDTAKGMQPVAGGLFDPKIFGDRGDRWASLSLPEPIVSPVMADPVRRLLGLTQQGLEDVIAGKMELPKLGGTGPAAIASALKNINLPRAVAAARQDVARRRGAGRDEAVRKLGYLLGAQKNGLRPDEWLLTKVPVLPPKFRPVGMLGDTKRPLVSDANYLYKELVEARDNLQELAKDTDDLGNERLAVYKAFSAVTGLTDPLSKKLQEKKVKGLLPKLLGSSPKMGTVQRRLLSSSVDLVGRSVVSPNPDLSMDDIGIPEDKAWSVFRNFVTRRLRRRGLPLSEAMRQVDDRTPVARSEMLNEMAERPIIMSRAPVLHRYGILAFRPRLTKASSLEVSPLVVKD